MGEAQKIFAEYEATLDAKELALIEHKKAVLDFVVAPHTVGETKQHLRQVHLAESSLIEVMKTLTEIRISSEFKDEAGKLCGRCKELNAYTRDMDKILADDLTEQHRAEDKKKRDIVKEVTFLIAPSATFVTAVKNGFGDGAINIYQAAGAGLVVSGGVLFHKRIFSAFQSVARAVCSTPKRISNSFTLYYMKEQIKDHVAEARAVPVKATKNVIALSVLSCATIKNGFSTLSTNAEKLCKRTPWLKYLPRNGKRNSNELG